MRRSRAKSRPIAQPPEVTTPAPLPRSACLASELSPTAYPLKWDDGAEDDERDSARVGPDRSSLVDGAGGTGLARRAAASSNAPTLSSPRCSGRVGMPVR